MMEAPRSPPALVYSPACICLPVANQPWRHISTREKEEEGLGTYLVVYTECGACSTLLVQPRRLHITSLEYSSPTASIPPHLITALWNKLTRVGRSISLCVARFAVPVDLKSLLGRGGDQRSRAPPACLPQGGCRLTLLRYIYSSVGP